MDLPNDPAYQKLWQMLPVVLVVGLPWWAVASVPYVIARLRRARARLAVRFLGLVAIFLQGFAAWVGILMAEWPDPVGAWVILPLAAACASALAWVVAVVIALMSDPVPRRRAPAGRRPDPGPDFEIVP